MARGDKQKAELVAHVALRRAFESGRVLVYTDSKIIGLPGTPAYSVGDVYVPPLILFAASITVLTAFGLLEWIAAMIVVVLIWAFVQPPILRWRRARRARAIAFATVEGLKAQWALGGFAFVLKDWPERNCVAPKGDWRAFATDYLVDAIDREAVEGVAAP